MTSPSPQPGLLFTAFERSGDEHAAPVIAELRGKLPGTPIWALGGSEMEKAGATLIQHTTDKAVMLAGAITQVRAHLARLKRLEHWLQDKPLLALVPVDSPAANWSICALIRKRQPSAKIIHLVAPQLWAWAPWRIRKMRRLSDHVLCLLPFEPQWFADRGMPATFVGHPLFDHQSIERQRTALLASAPDGSPKIALLPGSRQKEIEGNWPVMLQTLRLLRNEHPRAVAVVPAAGEKLAVAIRELTAGFDRPPLIVDGNADAVLRWCDLAVVASGTASLQAAAHRKPAVVIYNVGWLSWNLIGRLLVRSGSIALPNVIGRSIGVGPVMPEIIPHYHNAPRIADHVHRLLSDDRSRAAVLQGIDKIVAAFEGPAYANDAAKRIADMIANP